MSGRVERLVFTITPDCAGTRLDRCLSKLIPGSSRAYLQKLIREGLVRCGGPVVTLPRYPVHPGELVEVTVPAPKDPEAPLAAEPFAFPILYEDASMLVIDKPAGVVVHPAAGNPDGTVVNALLGRYPGMAEDFADSSRRPGIVHRLDKDTSGCLVIAKTPNAQFHLGTAFAERLTSKTYLAIVRGIPRRDSGEIANNIGRHPVNRQKMAIVERGGKLAITRYRVLKRGWIDGTPVALMEVKIATGRTHQIRVHMASLGMPVLGDALYGGRVTGLEVPRQLLHAWHLSVPHPETGEMLEFEAPVPEDFLAFRERISSENPGC